METPRPYHHGSLRTALVTGALEAIRDKGPSSVSLRDVARRTGVSHAAPAHHFVDKAGLFTAVATQGYELLADALESADREGGGLLELGVAYVRFAVDHREHFEVMFRSDLLHGDDPALAAASARAGAALTAGVQDLPGEPTSDPGLAAAAAWSIVHGFATLWLSGALGEDFGEDPERAARAVAGVLFRG